MVTELQTMIELTQQIQIARSERRLPDTGASRRVKLTTRQEELEKLLAQSTERWLISQGLVE